MTQEQKDFDQIVNDIQKKIDSGSTPQWDYLSSELGLGSPDIPSGLNLNMLKVDMFDPFPKDKLFVFEARAGSGKAVFVAWKGNITKPPPEKDDPKHYFFALQLSENFEIDKIPTIGDQHNWHLRVALAISSGIISKEEGDALYKIITGRPRLAVVTEVHYDDYPAPPTNGIKSRVAFTINFAPAGMNIPLTLEWKRVNDSGSYDLPQEHDNQVQKKAGPLVINRIHPEIDKNHIIWLKISGGLQRWGLKLILDGFGIGLSISDSDRKLQFSLDGIEVTYENPTLVIGGGLYGTFDPVNLWGELLIRVAEKFSFVAMGAYQKDDAGHPSFYGFLFVGGLELGEPPFFITGIAGGFGYNRSLKFPPLEGQQYTFPIPRLSKFPFIQAAMALSDTSGDFTNPFPSDTSDPESTINCLQVMQDYLPAQEGEDWAAAGISFTLCEVVNGFALLAVSWGVDFQIALIGLAQFSQPAGVPKEELVVFAELALIVLIAPDAGLFAIDAQLSPSSFVLSRKCHLTGGFGFYLWFGSNPHAGEFVLTLGGYHPDYKPPKYYPKEMRLGFNWQISSAMLVKGGAYLALTPSAIMLGGYLEAVWDKGPVRAWFDLELDCIVMWKPLHYDVYIGIHIGVSVRIKVWFVHITVTFHLGVDVNLWGPEFSGTAHVDLSVASFTIHFGADASKDAPKLTWNEFEENFLPKRKEQDQTQVSTERSLMLASVPQTETAVCDIQVAKGMIRNVGGANLDWVVDPEHLILRTQSQIPAKTYTHSGLISQVDGVGDRNTNFGVGPMQLEPDHFQSQQQISLTSRESDSTMTATAVKHKVPGALWNKDAHQHPVGDSAVINNALIGFELTPDPVAPDRTLPIDSELLRYTVDANIQHFQWAAPSVSTSDSFTNQTIAETIDSSQAQQNRDKILNALPDYLSISKNVDVSALEREDEFLAEPRLRLLGEIQS